MRLRAPAEESAPDGDDLIVWSRLRHSDWLLVEASPWRQVTQSSLRMTMALLAAGSASVLVALGFAYVMARQFTLPIRQLLRSMSGFGMQARSVQLPADYKNEFGSLFTGYRKLMERVAELYDRLESQYRKQKEAELKALQAMINPHFLYNSLDQLNWMAIEAGHKRMSHMLERMGKMFRIGLSKGESFITLREELEHAECYLQIQQIRWEEGLNYRLEMEDGLADCFVPKLTLQPFVENAILHGFHGRDRGLVTISARAEQEQLLLSVADDGIGLSPEWRSRRKGRGGYGVRNVEERIGSYFGPPYGVRLHSGDAGGTTVEIRLPLLWDRMALTPGRTAE